MKLFRNTRHKLLNDRWIKYRDLYEGDHDVLVNNDAYLIPHPLELMQTADAARLYKNRKARTRYLKLVEMVVSIWCSILYRESPAFDEETTALLEKTSALNDIDGEGCSFESFIVEEITPWFLIYGDIAILAESFGGNVESAAQEQELGLRPYLKLITPIQLVDWSKEASDPKRLGRFNFARYEYYKEEPRLLETDPIVRLLCSDSFRRDAAGKISIQKYFAELDEHGQPKAKKDGQTDWTVGDLIQLDARLDEIPLVSLQKETWVDGVCEEALRHFNHRSNLDSINHFQGYPSTFIFGVDPGEGKQYSLIAEHTITFIKDVDARVERLQASDSGSLERAVADALNMTFKVALDQVRSLPTDSKAVQGAETISEENRNLYTLLVSTIDRIETLTQAALNNFALLAGEKNFAGKVSFNREIKEEDINQLIRIFGSFADILKAVPGLTQAMAEKIIPKLKFDDEKEQELLQSLEAVKIEEPQAKDEDTDPVNQALAA